MAIIDRESELGERYRVLDLLAAGQGVETYRATDLHRGVTVVVKAIEADRVSTETQLRFQHEMAVLHRIRSSNLLALLDHGREDGIVYLVTPFFEGLTLEQRLRSGPLELPAVLTVGQRLMRALQAAHEHDVIHRDVKPANVMVNDGLSIERALLIDFGLSRSLLLEPELRQIPVGTVRYMAPEQAGVIPGGVDERSDLYSAGLTLFECLTGAPLLDGTTVGDVLRQHVTLHPPELGAVGVDAPEVLDAIFQRLLRKDPAERYQSAEAVRMDLDDLAVKLEQGVPNPWFVVGTHDRREVLVEPSFVGREDELAAMERCLARARRGRGALMLVEAASGGGKTRLLEECARRRVDDVWILRGQGLDLAAQRPFEVLTGIAREVATAAADDPGLATRLRRHLGEQGVAAVTAFPELAPILGVEGEEMAAPEEFGEVRTIRALAALLDALGTPERPALVLFDDCQWADELSVRLLGHWQQNGASMADAPPRHVLAVAAYRSEEVGPDHAIRRLATSDRLVLPPLGDEEVRLLAASMAGALPEDVLEVVVRLAEGSPFMASAVLRGLVESGALAATDEGWHVEPDVLADVRSSTRAAAFLVRRLELLDADVLRLLSVAAVLGKEFEIALATELSGVPAAHAARAIQTARRRHIVWTETYGARYTFVHDKLREALLSMLGDDERRALHGAAAKLLEERDSSRVFELAFHYDESGQPRLALSHALAAAEQARAKNALEAAEQQYRIAARAASDTDRPTRRRIAEELGRVLMLRGRYEEAAPHLAEARSLAEDAFTAARIDGEIGELAFKRGDMLASSEAVERGLRSLGQRVPRRTSSFILFTLWEIVVQVLHTLLPRLFLGRRSVEEGAADLLAARLYSRLTHSYWFQRGSIPTAFTHVREMNLAERYPPTLQLAQAYSEHAPVMTLLPWYGRGITYANRSFAIRSELGDVWGQGQSLHFHGVVLYAASRFEECLEKCREAIRLLERTGDRWEVNTARWHVAYCLYRLGDLRGAVEVAREVHVAGSEIGDTQARGIGLAVWSKASEGAVPSALLAREMHELDEENVHTTAEVLQAEGLRLLAAGEETEAVEVLSRADRLVRAKGLRQEYVAPVLPWLLTALRHAREAAPEYATRRRTELSKRSRRIARRARRLARAYENNLPHTLREVALLEAAHGRQRRARSLLDRSIAVAREQHADQEVALSLLARGEIGIEYDWPGADADLDAGRSTRQVALQSLDALVDEAPDREEVTVSLVERFDSVLEAGRRIASCLDPDLIFEAVRRAALALLRGEECLVVRPRHEADGDGGDTEPDAAAWFVAVGDPAADYSVGVVETASDARRPVVVSEGLEENVSDSVVLAGARSVLAAPIIIRGIPTACLYVTHREVGGLFGDDEVRLAAFISTLAGAALENASGFAEVEELSRTLEERVRDRTAELASTNRQLDESVARLQQAYDREREMTEQLQRLNQLKTDFLAMVAHDLRTPMTIVLGFASTLRSRWDTLEEGARGELLDRLLSNTRRQTELVENLLQFARIETGEFSYDIRPFDLGGLVHRTVAEFEDAAPTRRFDITLPRGLPRGLGDEQRYWQVLTNLLSNATKFSPEDTPVHVEVWHDEADLVVCVRDHGAGIRPEDTDQLFEKFAQLDQPPGESRAMGTGLGLYICKSIVEAQGGRIEVESLPGEGASLTFTVPIAGDETDAGIEPTRAGASPGDRPPVEHFGRGEGV